jgi:segregation and condensation protein B
MRRAKNPAIAQSEEPRVEETSEPGDVELDPVRGMSAAGEELRDEILIPAESRGAVQPDAAGNGPASERETEADAVPDAEAETEGSGPGELLTDDEILRSVTALVFASPEPISLRRIVELLERPETARVEAALASLRERLAQSALPLELRPIAGGWQILTTPEMGATIQRLFKARRTERISAAALETMAVVAYRQPVTKAEIEAIRGVQAGPILRTLVERGLVRVIGRADVPGHPLQYGTTRDFLDRFGLGSLDELPRDAELSKD